MTSTENIVKIAAEILVKHFPDGLALDDDRRFNEFRNYFEDVLGAEADRFFISKVREFVETAGEKVGKLVFPKKSAGTNATPMSERSVVASVLLRFFTENGFRLDSEADSQKLRTLAGSEFLSKSTPEIVKLVSSLIRPYEGVSYPINKKTHDRVQTTFEEIFQSGCKIIYYSVLFDKNRNWLIPNGVFDAYFLTDRIRVFFPKLSHHVYYFEETSSELPELEKIKEEILRVWNPNDQQNISVEELAEQTYVPTSKLEEALKNYDDYEKVGGKWRLVVKDELEAPNDVELFDRFDYLPLSVASQEEEEERRRTAEEDPLSVHDEEKESQEEEPINETPEAEETTSEENEPSHAIRLTYPVSSSDVTFTKPVMCFYRKEALAGVCDWNELYPKIVNRLFREHASILLSKLNQSLGKGKKPDFADEKSKDIFNKPKPVTDNFYIEGTQSTDQIVNKIKTIFELCGADLNDLEIWYQKRDAINKNGAKPVARKAKTTQSWQSAPQESVNVDAGILLNLDAPLDSVTSSKPTLCRYRGQTFVGFTSWSQLYAAVITRLLEEFPQKMRSRLNQSLGTWKKPDFADEETSACFIRPAKIDDDFYIELNFSAERFIKRIKLALELCDVETDELEIWYRRNEDAALEQTNDASESVQYPIYLEEEDDFFANAPELCQYRTDEADDDSAWLFESGATDQPSLA